MYGMSESASIRIPFNFYCPDYTAIPKQPRQSLGREVVFPDRIGENEIGFEFGYDESPTRKKAPGLFGRELSYGDSRGIPASMGLRAGDGIRTHDNLLGKQMRYHCATPAESYNL